MNDIQLYDEYAVKHEAAFAAFSRIHESKNPRPELGTVQRDLVSSLIVAALAVVMFAAVAVSMSRTINEFGGGFIGAAAFVMVEGGIMVYALFRARRTASTARLRSTVKWATAGLILTFIIGIGANIDNALTHKGIQLPDWINVVVNLLVAISAPTLAFISSDVLAIELMAMDIKRREALEHYNEQMSDWLEGLNKSWSSQQGKWGVRIDVPSPAVVSIPSSIGISNGIPLEQPTQLAASTLGHSKVVNASEQCRQYLLDNPDALELSPLEIAKLAGVGKSTAYKVVAELKGK